MPFRSHHIPVFFHPAVRWGHKIHQRYPKNCGVLVPTCLRMNIGSTKMQKVIIPSANGNLRQISNLFTDIPKSYQVGYSIKYISHRYIYIHIMYIYIHVPLNDHQSVSCNIPLQNGLSPPQIHGRFGPETSPGVGLPGEVLHGRDACWAPDQDHLARWCCAVVVLKVLLR
jgi:hypothetical protein